uniref:Uncharacterized protein n=1 Tax=Arundo donax TaxID=35708 RepID=A0A0A8ZMA7_ARUDO
MHVARLDFSVPPNLTSKDTASSRFPRARGRCCCVRTDGGGRCAEFHDEMRRCIMAAVAIVAASRMAESRLQHCCAACEGGERGSCGGESTWWVLQVPWE